MTQILPFIIFRVGLDDAYVMNDVYNCTVLCANLMNCIQEAIKDINVSITMTTLMSVLAFGLGCITSIPTILWLSLYAFPTVGIVLIYQLMFVVV